MKKTIVIWILILSVVYSFAQNPRNVVLYNLTSTGCGPCSCMDSIIRNGVLAKYPNTLVIALHSPTSMGGSYFWKYQGSEIYNEFHSLRDPDGYIDGQGHDVLYKDVADSIGKRLQDSPESPVMIEVLRKTWNPATRVVDMSTRITNISSELPGQCKLEICCADGRQTAQLVDQRLEPGFYNVEHITSALPPGNYLVRLQTPSGESIKKLVLTHQTES